MHREQPRESATYRDGDGRRVDSDIQLFGVLIFDELCFRGWFWTESEVYKAVVTGEQCPDVLSQGHRQTGLLLYTTVSPTNL